MGSLCCMSPFARTSPASSAADVTVHRVRKAYEQVSDQLRELIVSGHVHPGDRLPSEASLSQQFGVSRATVREALRVLAAQSLITTSKGATGGSFISLPTTDHISNFISSNIGLLSQTESISLDDFLELREFLEVPAARLAAGRHSASADERIAGAIPDRPLELSAVEQFVHNRDFHLAVVFATQNTLLVISAQPIFSAMQTSLQRSDLGRKFHQQVNEDHRQIAAAITSGDEDTAGEAMLHHLGNLRPHYERAWSAARIGRRR